MIHVCDLLCVLLFKHKHVVYSCISFCFALFSSHLHITNVQMIPDISGHNVPQSVKDFNELLRPALFFLLLPRLCEITLGVAHEWSAWSARVISINTDPLCLELWLDQLETIQRAHILTLSRHCGRTGRSCTRRLRWHVIPTWLLRGRLSVSPCRTTLRRAYHGRFSSSRLLTCCRILGGWQVLVARWIDRCIPHRALLLLHLLTTIIYSKHLQSNYQSMFDLTVPHSCLCGSKFESASLLISLCYLHLPCILSWL